MTGGKPELMDTEVLLDLDVSEMCGGKPELMDNTDVLLDLDVLLTTGGKPESIETEVGVDVTVVEMLSGPWPVVNFQELEVVGVALTMGPLSVM